jgi:hypothetical protein
LAVGEKPRLSLFHEKLGVLGDEAVGGELADHTPSPPVDQPRGAHTESNGSHVIVPPGKIRVWSEIGLCRGSKLSPSVVNK